MASQVKQWEKQSITDLAITLENLYQTMISYQLKTQYSNAQLYRNLYEDCKTYILQRKVEEAEERYRNDVAANNTSRSKQLTRSRKYWNEKIKEYNAGCDRFFNELQKQHEHQCSTLRAQMQEQLSLTVKQSNQLINLRIMESHASNQKNFVQANSIQQKVKKLYEAEKATWMEGREKTIQQGIKNLKNKQNNQIQGINRKIKLTLQDYAKQMVTDEQKINQRNDNLLKELKGQYERQVLSLHGQLKNLGGKSPKKEKAKRKKDPSVNKDEQEEEVD